jgi:regulator of sirC expression with transglutaminase-like and TPR domain
LHAHLLRKKERIAGLDEGIKSTGSGVLENERIDALIDDHQFEAALAKIEKELDESRWKSTWLIRRAKVRLGTEKKAEAKMDLEAAIAEIQTRINLNSPDPSLLADRGTARELLGNREGARKDYEDARDKGVTEEWLLERIRALKEKGKEDSAEKK